MILKIKSIIYSSHSSKNSIIAIEMLVRIKTRMAIKCPRIINITNNLQKKKQENCFVAPVNILDDKIVKNL